MNVKHVRCIHELRIVFYLILAHKTNRTMMARSVDFHRRCKLFSERSGEGTAYKLPLDVNP